VGTAVDTYTTEALNNAAAQPHSTPVYNEMGDAVGAMILFPQLPLQPPGMPANMAVVIGADLRV